MKRICFIPGCLDIHHGKGYCKKHFQRYYRNGHTVKKRKLYCYLNKVKRSSGTEYWVTRVDGKERYVHRVAMEQYLGRPLKTSEIVHHKDGNGLNNWPLNLE